MREEEEFRYVTLVCEDQGGLYGPQECPHLYQSSHHTCRGEEQCGDPGLVMGRGHRHTWRPQPPGGRWRQSWDEVEWDKEEMASNKNTNSQDKLVFPEPGPKLQEL